MAYETRRYVDGLDAPLVAGCLAGDLLLIRGGPHAVPVVGRVLRRLAVRRGCGGDGRRRRRLLLRGRLAAREDQSRGRSHHQLAVFGLEPGDQSELSLRAVHFAPGQPEAVRIAQLDLIVVPGQVLFQKDELSLGQGGHRIVGPGVEGINGERPVDLHRLVLAVEERDPAAETTDGRQTRLP